MTHSFQAPRSLIAAFVLAAPLFLINITLAQETPSGQETTDDSLQVAAEPADEAVVETVEKTDTAKPADQPKRTPLTPEEQAAVAAAQADFASMCDQLADAVLQMRTTYIHYQNDEDQSPKAKAKYREQRDHVRDLMRKTYDAADRLLLVQFDQEAVTFVGTSIQHREKNDIYDEPTLRGSTQLIDGGARELFLFLAAARSAVTIGETDLAKRLYETIGDEQMEDADRSLLFQLDQIQEQWSEEVQRREQDKKKNLPRVRLKTTRGDAVVELFIDSAPSAVSNFIRLVEEGFYDGLDFYQVMDHLLALTGDASGDGRGNTGQFLLDEHEREDVRYGLRGSLIMAKIPIADSGTFVPDSASSQFAILYLPVPNVSDHQTVFGRVIEGMDVISSLRRVDPSEEGKDKKVIIPPDRILTAEVIRRPKEMPLPKYVDLQKRVQEAQRHLRDRHSDTAAP